MVFASHKRRYGARRIVSELAEEGVKIGRCRVASLRKERKLLAIQPKSLRGCLRFIKNSYEERESAIILSFPRLKNYPR